MTSWCDNHGDYPLSRLNHVRCCGCGVPVRSGARAADLAVDWIVVEDGESYFFENVAAETTGADLWQMHDPPPGRPVNHRRVAPDEATAGRPRGIRLTSRA